MICNKFDDFLKRGNINYLKIFFILFYKKFSWEKELELEFNFLPQIVSKTIEILKKENLLEVENLNDIKSQKRVEILNFKKKYPATCFPDKIYLMSERGKENYLVYRNEIEELLKEDNFIVKTMSLIDENKNLNQNKRIKFFENIDIEDLKVFLVLYHKGYTWEKELEFDFGISREIITLVILKLKKDNILISSNYWNLDIDEQEIICKINAGYIKRINSYPKFYVLTPRGRKIYEDEYKIDIDNLIENYEDLVVFLEQVKQKVRDYNILKREVKQKQNKLDYVYRTDPVTGILFKTKTLNQKRREQEIRKIISKTIESKGGLVKLDDYKKDLAIEKFHKTGEKAKTLYNSKTISNNEIEEKLLDLLKEDKVLEKAEIEKGNNFFDIEKRFKKLKRTVKTQTNGGSLRMGAVFVSEDNFDRELKERLFSTLNIDDSCKQFNLAEENINLFDSIIFLIQKHKKISFFKVESMCENEELFNSFLKYIDNKRIYIDEECDFFIFME